MAADTVRLRVRYRKSGHVHAVRRRTSLPLKQLSDMTLQQFQQFVATQVGLKPPVAVAFLDEDGDRIPVTSEEELNVLAYVAELTSRRGRELEVRVRDTVSPTKPTRPTATAASHSSSKTSLLSAAPAHTSHVDLLTRVDEWYRKSLSQRAAATPGTARRQYQWPADGGGGDRSASVAAAAVEAQPAADTQARSPAAAPGAPAASAHNDLVSSETLAKEAMPTNKKLTSRNSVPADAGSRQVVATSTVDGPETAALESDTQEMVEKACSSDRAVTTEKERWAELANSVVQIPAEPPDWFAPFMKQFQRDVLSEMTSSIKAEFQQLMTTSTCNCSCVTAPVAHVSAASEPATDLCETGVQTSPSTPDTSLTAALAAAIERGRPPPTTDSAPVQTAAESPTTGAGPPIDRFGLFSVPVSESGGGSLFSGKTVVSSSRGGSVAALSGHSVVVPGGSGSWVDVAGGGSVTTSSPHTELQTPVSLPRPISRPEDEEYRCMLVMMERTAVQIPQQQQQSTPEQQQSTPEQQPGSTQEQQHQQQSTPEQQQQQSTPEQQPESTPEQQQQQSTPEQQPESTQEQHQQQSTPEQQQQQSTPEQQQQQSTPEQQQQQSTPEQQQQLTPHRPRSCPRLVHESVTEDTVALDQMVTPDEDYVTVNGRRLSLSEDDFSDIVVISSPDGSEPFQMVDPEPGADAPPVLTTSASDVLVTSAADTLLASALSERWVDADLSLGSGSQTSGRMASWLSETEEALTSVCPPSPAEQHGQLLSCSSPAHPDTVCPPESAAPSSWTPVSLEQPLSALPPQLRSRLLDHLQQLPEHRQQSLAEQLTGRRSLEDFWQRLSAAAEVTGRSLLEELLLDQAERPCGVGLLLDALLAQVLAIKQRGAGSAVADAEGAQALKHALYVLRTAVPEQELAESDSESEATAPRQPEQSAAADTAVCEEPALLVTSDSVPELPYAETEVLRPVSVQQQEEAGAAGRLAALLPLWVRAALQHRPLNSDAPPSRAEAETIALLVDMGFTDLERIRHLYHQLHGDCAAIVSHLLDTAHR